MPRVLLLGVGSTSLSREVRDGRWLAHDAVAAALADAGLAGGEVESVAVASGEDNVLRGCLDAIGGPVRSTECEGGHGALALHSAWSAVASGAAEVAVCLGHDPAPDARERAAVEALAAATRLYMRESGATEQHLARVAAKNRGHGAANPRALVRCPVDAAAILASPPLAWPLRRLMVAPPAQAAAAIVLAASERGRRAGPRAPHLPAQVLLSGGEGRPPPAARAAGLAYFRAALGPEDVDLVEVEDPTPAVELAAYEALELAPAQRGPELVEAGFTELGGVVPVNVSGGTLAQGRVPGSGAILQLIELAQQLRGRAGRRQVPGARVGLALCGDAIGPAAATSLTVLAT